MGQSEKDQASEFLATLFGDPLPADHKICLWSGKTKKTSQIEKPTAVGPFVGRPDVYVSALLTRRKIGDNQRVSKKNADALPGVWADIDVLGGPEDKPGKRAAPDRETAIALASSILPPTMLVNSGYGIQAWWLFEEPVLLANDLERERALEISTGWQAMLRQQANAREFSIDATHDLARLMRLPGTINDKGSAKVKAPVTLLEADGQRHSFEVIAQIATEGGIVVPSGAGTKKVDLTTAFPMRKFEAFRDNDENFRKTWEHHRKDREVEGWSTSEYDMALASMAAKRGWTDDEIAALIVAHRQKHNGEGDEKSRRVDYIGRTVGRARAVERREERGRVKTEALHELAELGESAGPPDPKQSMSLFNSVVGSGDPNAPRFKELIQYSTEPDSARYVLITEDGKEINVGPYRNLRQPRRLDERLGPGAQFVMETIKDNDMWRDAVRTLIRTVTIREEEDEPVLEWVRRYTEDRLGGSREAAAVEGEPFDEGEWVYIKAENLARFAKRSLAENITRDDLYPLLKKAGFEAKRVHFTGRNGKETTASYWRISKDQL